MSALILVRSRNLIHLADKDKHGIQLYCDGIDGSYDEDSGEIVPFGKAITCKNCQHIVEYSSDLMTHVDFCAEFFADTKESNEFIKEGMPYFRILGAMSYSRSGCQRWFAGETGE